MDGVDERTPLLEHPREGDGKVHDAKLSARLLRKLYTSHFLSAWNSRMFEFGAILYLATIYPGTLAPMSIYALIRGLSAIVFAPVVGRLIDTCRRLPIVRFSIVAQRLTVAASCAVFFLLTRFPFSVSLKNGLLALLFLLACAEKLSSIMNQVSIEKDWVIVIANKQTAELRKMNAQMRRIDLLCKIFAPLVISIVAAISSEIAIVVNFAINLLSVTIEYFAIEKVYSDVPHLHGPKLLTSPVINPAVFNRSGRTGTLRFFGRLGGILRGFAADFQLYFHHRIFLASFSGALLYLTVLSFGGQMVTYLLSVGYSSTQIAMARTLSVAFEVSATWIAPWLIGRIGPIRAGLWLSSWQVTFLVLGVTVFVAVKGHPFLSAGGLIIGTILSRVGLWGFDLSSQIIVQEDVEEEHRGAFSSVEAAWQNVFELLSFSTTIVLSRPEQFQWAALISVGATLTANILYAIFVHTRRGHLMHLEVLSTCLGNGNEKRRRLVTVDSLERIASARDA